MPREALVLELVEERRAVLEALPRALRECGLPLVMPKLQCKPGRGQAAKYDELVSTTRRSDGTTKGTALMHHLIVAVNAARARAARRLQLAPREPLEAPAFFWRRTVLHLWETSSASRTRRHSPG